MVDQSPPAPPTSKHLSQVERIDKNIDHVNRVALVNEIIEAFGQKRPLPTIRSSIPPQNHGRIITAAQRFHTAKVSRYLVCH
jgi:hypothetical protein